MAARKKAAAKEEPVELPEPETLEDSMEWELLELEERLSQEDATASLKDYRRLVRLEKKMGEAWPQETKVTWIEKPFVK